ncbi:MAG: phosphodiester glycosidase family protein [Melioribacteraceae bacterium]|nr:phosphodiester glycosidase family protein [Melioribacteraceae bacterium]
MKYKLNCILILIFISALQIFGYDTLYTKIISDECVLFHIADTAKPVVINMLEIDLTSTDISIDIVISHDRLNSGGERVSEMIGRRNNNGDRILAGINADFFGNNPVQAQSSIIINGEVVKAVNIGRTQIAFSENNVPLIGMFRFKGVINKKNDWILSAVNSFDTANTTRMFTHHWTGYIKLLKSRKYFLLNYDGIIEPNRDEVFIVQHDITLSDSIQLNKGQSLLELVPYTGYTLNDTLSVYFDFDKLNDDVRSLTGGLPLLFYGKDVPDSDTEIGKNLSPNFLAENPRTAIGYNENKTKLYIMVADGRQPAYSKGLTILELAKFMSDLGCYDALNLDGGGSSAMCVGSDIINRPSDLAGERRVYNAIVIKK